MRRYIFSGTVSAENTESYDVCIVGSGIAGLYAAIHIDPSMRTAVITKGMIDRSNSWLAQGGIASVISPDDYYASHIDDTLKAGAGLCDKKAVELLVEQGPDDIRELIDLDVPFDRNPEGELQITREGGHSRRRIVHCCGDATGRETTRRLGEIALERKHINIMFNTYVVDVVSDDSGIIGLIVFDDKPRFIRCSNIIVASGGVGHLYLSTTNPDGAIGDGIAMSQRAGAEIFGMELVQFHPTTLCVGRDVERAFLISEAVRGEGGILKNNRGEAFMQGVHPLADLAPRDIVTRAIIKEMN
ncbi:MAG: FAD-dependent oxidoreductase, partial [Clostridia bacterium]|nr:FAD-dependent oxidoreductase [Clostridia bacterium]